MKTLREIALAALRAESPELPVQDDRLFVAPIDATLRLAGGAPLLSAEPAGAGRVRVRATGQDPIAGAKSARALSRSQMDLRSLAVLTAEPEHVRSEDDDGARLEVATVLAVLNGWRTLARFGAGADLAGIALRGADLHGARFENTDLRDADLRGANLARASFKRARLAGADLQGADLTRANLFGADLSQADLRRARLSESEMRQAVVAGCSFRGAELWGTILWEVDLGSAFTEGADLSRADLRGS